MDSLDVLNVRNGTYKLRSKLTELELPLSGVNTWCATTVGTDVLPSISRVHQIAIYYKYTCLLFCQMQISSQYLCVFTGTELQTHLLGASTIYTNMTMYRNFKTVKFNIEYSKMISENVKIKPAILICVRCPVRVSPVTPTCLHGECFIKLRATHVASYRTSGGYHDNHLNPLKSGAGRRARAVHSYSQPTHILLTSDHNRLHTPAHPLIYLRNNVYFSFHVVGIRISTYLQSKLII